MKEEEEESAARPKAASIISRSCGRPGNAKGDSGIYRELAKAAEKTNTFRNARRNESRTQRHLQRAARGLLAAGHADYFGSTYEKN